MTTTTGRPAGRTIDRAAVEARMAELGLTQADLAHRLGITRAGASNLIRGDSGVTLERAARLAAALELEVEDILEESPLEQARRVNLQARMVGSGMQADKLWDHRAILSQVQALLTQFQYLEKSTRHHHPLPEGHAVTQAHRRAVAAISDLHDAVVTLEAALLESAAQDELDTGGAGR